VILCAHLGENYKTDGYVITPKTMQLLEEHLKAIDGRVKFCFLDFFSRNFDIMSNVVARILCCMQYVIF